MLLTRHHILPRIKRINGGRVIWNLTQTVVVVYYRQCLLLIIILALSWCDLDIILAEAVISGEILIIQVQTIWYEKIQTRSLLWWGGFNSFLRIFIIYAFVSKFSIIIVKSIRLVVLKKSLCIYGSNYFRLFWNYRHISIQ